MSAPVIAAARCSTCSAWADTVHLLPWVTRVRRVEFACPDHDPGGYTIDLDAYGVPARRDTWAHVAGKGGGLRAIAALATALAEQRDRRRAEDREFDVREPGTIGVVSAADLRDEGAERVRAFQRLRRDRGHR